MACYGAPPAGWGGAREPAEPVNADCMTAGEDLDRDGWCDTDCDEVNADVFPGAADPPGDGLDQNCDGVDGDAAGGADRPPGPTQTIAR